MLTVSTDDHELQHALVSHVRIYIAMAVLYPMLGTPLHASLICRQSVPMQLPIATHSCCHTPSQPNEDSTALLQTMYV